MRAHGLQKSNKIHQIKPKIIILLLFKLTMAMEIRPPNFPILSIFLFSTLWLLYLSNARRVRDPEYEVLRCLDKCDDTDIFRSLMCQKECELEYRRREDLEESMGTRRLDHRWRPSGGRGNEGDAVNPQREYEKCRRSCRYVVEVEEGEECEERCEELLRALERKRDREREREFNGGGKNELKPSLKLIGTKKDKHQEEKQGSQGNQQIREREHEETMDRFREYDRALDCQKRCQRFRRGQERQLCKFRCMQQNRRDAEREKLNTCKNKAGYPFQEQGRLSSGDDNPYYFNSRRFKTRFRSENVGRFRVLEKFTKNSKLLRGIADYRLAIFEAEYNTFVLPHYNDADNILVVLEGKVTIILITQGKRECYALENRDVVAVPAGTMAYIVNAECEQVQIAMLTKPINTPSKFQEFFPVGKPYYSIFTSEFLETALNTTRDQLEKLFAQQRQDTVFRAPVEVLQELSQTRCSRNKKKSHGIGSKGKGLSQKPIYSNKFGRLFKASLEKFKQLRDLGITVTDVELKQGSMFLPHFNTRTIAMMLVVEGNGTYEMGCPQVHRGACGYQETEGESEEQEEGLGHYHKVSSGLSPGDVFVIPPGHPIIIVASRNQNLRMVGFGINAENNQIVFLAGKGNIIDQIENEAKELAFGVPVTEVDKVFNNQDASYFVSSQQDCGEREEEECEKSLEAS